MRIQLDSDMSDVQSSEPEMAVPSRLINLHKHEAELAGGAARVMIEPVEDVKKIEPAKEQVELGVITEVAKLDEPEVADELALSIAADYTKASLGAAAANLPVRASEETDKLSAAIHEVQGKQSIDEVAQIASQSVAAIRAASDPDDAAKQIEALKSFSERLKGDKTIPEMAELSETIDQFIAIAEKTTGMKAKRAAREANSRVKMGVIRSVDRKTEFGGVKIGGASRKASGAARKVESEKLGAVKTRGSRPVRAAAKPVKTAKKPLFRRARRSSVAIRPEEKKTVLARTMAPEMTERDLALQRAAKKAAQRKNERTPKLKVRRKGGAKRFILALSCTAACIAAIVYFVGSNIPDVSVRVAAMQTGVEASYPSYVPRGYSLKDISSEDGKIVLNFADNEGGSFTLTEEKSSWDSAALQRNYVEGAWQNGYSTTHEQGITIFMNSSNAAWVNGGVLYKINSTSNTLTKKQLRNIVTSMQ